MLGLTGFIKKKLDMEGKLPDKWKDIPTDVGGATPLNVKLIPNMTSKEMDPSFGKVGVSGIATEENMIDCPQLQESLESTAWIFFSEIENGFYAAGYSTEYSHHAAMSFWYELDSSQYNNGFFDPGVYSFETKFGYSGSEALVQGDIYIQNEKDEWIKVARLLGDELGNVTSMTPCTLKGEFTADVKFKAIKFVKINTLGLTNSANYYRYGTQITKIK